MNKTQYPKISEVNSNEEGFRIFFDGGDLGKRKNVNNLNDFIECQKLFDIEFDKVGGLPNLKEFYWSINYQIPNLEQYEIFLKTKQYENDYPFEKNYHRYTPLNYIYEKKNLIVEPFFFLIGASSFIPYIIDYLEAPKKISIYLTASLEGMMADQFVKDKIMSPFLIEDFLQKNFGHKDFFPPHLLLKKNVLDDLIEIKNKFKSKIEIEFPDASSEDKDILKKNELID